MERKLTKVVDGTEITETGKMCSCGTDVANDLCSWESTDTCGDCLLTIAQSSSLSGFVAYFEGNISTKIGLKICACIEKLNTGVVKIDLLA